MQGTRWKFTGDPSRKDEAREVAGGDDEHISIWLSWAVSGERSRAELEKRLRCEAKALIDQHWPSVVALAQELLVHTTLDVYEATYVVAIAEGERAKIALAEYRRAQALFAIGTRERVADPTTEG